MPFSRSAGQRSDAPVYTARHYAPARGPRRAPALALRHVVLVVVLVATVVAAAVDHGRAHLGALAGVGTSLDWEPCGAHHEECATVAVPLDYAHPGRRSIDIAVDRFKATGGAPPLGVLLVNPGGPGGSGIELAQELEGVLPTVIRERFDLIGFDPRGVGKSAPVRCPVVEFPSDVPATDSIVPRTDEERNFRVEQVRDIAADCAHGSDWLLPYVGTEYAARDIDAIRGALGQQKINYLGFSYGTVLGATYLSLYPEHVRAMVLDGVAPSDYASQLDGEAQADAFHQDLTDFLTWCVRNTCPLGDGDVASAHADLSQLLDQLSDKPLETSLGDDRPLDVYDAFGAVVGSMYVTLEWPSLKDALAQAENGDGTDLLTLADAYQERDKNGIPQGNMAEANLAIHCADNATRGQTVAQAEANAAAWSVQAPLFGPVNAWDGLVCSDWMATATPPIKYQSGPSTPPFLLVGATGDPATPYAWAKQVAGQFSSARLLTRTGDGHTSYLRGSHCVDSAIDDYLVDLTLPPAGTTCASAPVPPA